MNRFYKEVYRITSLIPYGKVTSYGRIAAIIGKPRSARIVGYALSSLSKDLEQSVPWQRVINSRGRISFKGDSYRAKLQRELLLSEGIVFDESGSVDWDVYGWP